jgi:hypothetical protein
MKIKESCNMSNQQAGISPESAEMLSNAYAEHRQTVAEYKDGPMAENFAERIAQSDAELTPEQIAKVAEIFKIFIDENIHKIADSYDFM